MLRGVRSSVVAIADHSCFGVCLCGCVSSVNSCGISYAILCLVSHVISFLASCVTSCVILCRLQAHASVRDFAHPPETRRSTIVFGAPTRASGSDFCADADARRSERIRCNSISTGSGPVVAFITIIRARSVSEHFPARLPTIPTSRWCAIERLSFLLQAMCERSGEQMKGRPKPGARALHRALQRD